MDNVAPHFEEFLAHDMPYLRNAYCEIIENNVSLLSHYMFSTFGPAAASRGLVMNHVMNGGFSS